MCSKIDIYNVVSLIRSLAIMMWNLWIERNDIYCTCACRWGLTV